MTSVSVFWKGFCLFRYKKEYLTVSIFREKGEVNDCLRYQVRGKSTILSPTFGAKERVSDSVSVIR
jgi:hypothetical protein